MSPEHGGSSAHRTTSEVDSLSTHVRYDGKVITISGEPAELIPIDGVLSEGDCVAYTERLHRGPSPPTTFVMVLVRRDVGHEYCYAAPIPHTLYMTIPSQLGDLSTSEVKLFPKRRLFRVTRRPAHR